MARIPEEVINDIRSKARIEDIIGSFINVTKKGNNYIAYCPFHDDHDPSLHISAEKQIFKCFACPAEEGSAGDVFKFVMKYKHLDYIDAVRLVAEMIGYKYDFGTRHVNTFQETVTHKITREAMVYCQYELNTANGLKYKEYLHKRNISDEQITKFGIGYNPNGDKLCEFLHKKGYRDQDIIDANLGRLTANGIRDVFYDRIMIPIMDVDGHPIGFTARSIDPNNDAKYINTADTPIFHKSDVVFNLNRIREVAREKRYLIMVEGPMDVMAFDRAGLTNAVCAMGTATTKNQLAMIKQFTSNLILAYDGDNAGQGAILKTGKLALESGFAIKVLNNSTDLDPDEIINKYGKDELTAMVNKPKTWIEFIMSHYQKQYDLNNYSDRKSYANTVLAEINKLSDNFDRENYMHALAEQTGFSYSLLSANGADIQAKAEVQRPVQNRPVKLNNGLEIAQKTILKQMLASPTAISVFKRELGSLPDEQYNTLAYQIIDYGSQNPTIVVSQFIDKLPPELGGLLYEISEDEMLASVYDEELLNDSIIKIKIEDLETKKTEIEKQSKSLNDGYMIARMLQQSTLIKQQISELKGKLSTNTRRRG